MQPDKIISKINISYTVMRMCIFFRRGVEETRLEAKAKNTKKVRGQGQPFRGQILLRPRTGMLKAKSKVTGRKCSQKKGLKIFFQAISKKKTVSKKIFQAIHKILTIQKLVLSSSRGQNNFLGLEASRPVT